MINIHKLIDNNQWDKIYNLLKNKKIDSYNKIANGNIILHYASIHNNSKLIKYFLTNDLNAFNKSNDDGDSPMHLLAKYNYTTLLKDILIKNSEGLNLLNNKGENILNILYSNHSFIKWALEYLNGKIIVDDNEGQNIVTKNIKKTKNKTDDSYKIITLLIKDKPEEINNYKKNSLLCYSIENNKNHVVDLLLENNYNVNQKDFKYMAPLTYAVINNDYSLIKRLLKKGADINYNGPEGDQNSMIYAINNGDEKLIKILLDHGFNLNSHNRNLDTPLHYALSKKNKNLKSSTISTLIYYGDMNLKNTDGITPLHLLCKYHSIENFSELIKHKELDIFIQDNKRKSPLDYIKGNDIYPFLDTVIYSYISLLDGKIDNINKCKKGNMSKDCQLELKKYIFQTKRSIPIKEDKKLVKSKIKMISGISVNHGLFNADTLHNMIYTVILLKRYKNLCIPYQYFNQDRYINDKIKLSNNIIKSDSDKIITDLIHIYTENFYELTPYLIVWKNINQYYVHDNLKFMLKKCLFNQSVRFVFLKLSLLTNFNTLHANIILYDKLNNTLERFEPYGDVPYIESNELDKFIENLGRQYINTNLKYYSPKDIMGNVGFQVISNDSKQYVKKLGDPFGYCLAWTIWYIEMRINNPQTDPINLIKNMKDNIVNSSKNDTAESLFISFIRDYSAILDKLKNEFMMNAGISVGSVYNLVFDNEDEKKIISKMKEELNSLFRG